MCWGVFLVLTLYSPRSIVWGLFFFSSCYAVFFFNSTCISLLIILVWLCMWRIIKGRPIIGADIKHFTDYRYRPFEKQIWQEFIFFMQTNILFTGDIIYWWINNTGETISCLNALFGSMQPVWAQHSVRVRRIFFCITSRRYGDNAKQHRFYYIFKQSSVCFFHMFDRLFL